MPLFVSDPNQVSKKQSNLLGDSSAGTVSMSRNGMGYGQVYELITDFRNCA